MHDKIRCALVLFEILAVFFRLFDKLLRFHRQQIPLCRLRPLSVAQKRVIPREIIENPVTHVIKISFATFYSFLSSLLNNLFANRKGGCVKIQGARVDRGACHRKR